MCRTQFRDNIRVLQFITFTVIYIYRGSRVHIFRADIQFARFPAFFFFYIDHNDAVEPRRQDFSRVIGAVHLVWNDDKMINLCSFMRYFGQRNALRDPLVPIGDNKSPRIPLGMLLKISRISEFCVARRSANILPETSEKFNKYFSEVAT